MQVADVTVKLPAPPQQVIPLTNRLVEVSGNIPPDGVAAPEALPPEGVEVKLSADLNGTVTVTVYEVIANGNKSPPCSLSFVPYHAIAAASADPSGYGVVVTAIRELPEPPPVPA